MRTDHLLVAIDLKGNSREVVEAAAALASKLGARVTLLTVVSPPAGVNPFGQTEGTRNDQILDENAYGDMAPFVAVLEAEGIAVTRDLGHGDPAAAIGAAIERHDPGFVVMGSHARTGLARAIFGSVSEGVVASSSVPILVVRSAASSLDPRE